MELEKELMKSKQAYDSLHNGKDSSKPEGSLVIFICVAMEQLPW